MTVFSGDFLARARLRVQSVVFMALTAQCGLLAAQSPSQPPYGQGGGAGQFPPGAFQGYSGGAVPAGQPQYAIADPRLQAPPRLSGLSGLSAGGSPADAGALAALRGLSLHAYAPSYVGVDRASAVLKALGYPVIEYLPQTSLGDGYRNFIPNFPDDLKPPVIITFPDSGKTSLMDPSRAMPATGFPPDIGSQVPGVITGSNAVPDIGGAYLHGITSSEMQQRMLIAYAPDEPDSLANLLSVLNESIDKPASQIVIEALVIELNSNKLRDIGVTFQSLFGDKFGAEFQRDASDQQLPAVFTFDDTIVSAMSQFRASIRALVSTGDAEVLSNPSVLVLDGRQARIQVGQQIPVTTSTATDSFVQANVDYFPVGIVLNLRPRVSADGSEVAMQVETIVSAVNAQASAPNSTDNIVRAPVVDNRQVQTFVRVANNTPFIIGGLIASEDSDAVQGIPGLSSIPGLGRLFQRRVRQNTKSEVIIVITPHVVPLGDTQFSYTRPRDSEVFDSKGNKLFLDRYRVRSEEVFDLDYLENSDVLKRAQQRSATWLDANPTQDAPDGLVTLAQGGIPGEEVLVRRMIWETSRQQPHARQIRPERLVLFTKTADDETPQFRFLSELVNALNPDQALVLKFPPKGALVFQQPAAVVEVVSLKGQSVSDLSRRYNQNESQAVVLTNNAGDGLSPISWLQSAVVLKNILDLNSNLALELDAFYTGRQLVYPSLDDLSEGFHLVGPDIAQYWYELQHYYPAFERQLNAALRTVATATGETTISSSGIPAQGAGEAGADTPVDCGSSGTRGPRKRLSSADRARRC